MQEEVITHNITVIYDRGIKAIHHINLNCLSTESIRHLVPKQDYLPYQHKLQETCLARRAILAHAGSKLKRWKFLLARELRQS